MQQISLQRSILYTILHFALFCAIATGCHCCKGSIDKSTTIHIETKPGEKEKSEPKEARPDASMEKNALATTDKEGKEKKKNNGNNEDEDIKQKIEEELVAEQTRLAEEESLLKEEEPEGIIGNPNYDQHSSYGYSNSPEPSAPEFGTPPPSYESHGFGSKNSASSYNESTPISSNRCGKCGRENNRAFDQEDIKDLRNNLSKKHKIPKYKEVINKLREKLELYWNTKDIYMFKDKLSELKDQKANLEEENSKISSNRALCSLHKAEKLKYNFIEIDKIDYNMQHLESIITQVRKKKNNKSDQSTNKETPPYSTQEYASAPQKPVQQELDPPPPYRTTTNNPDSLYPNLSTNYQNPIT